MEGYSVTEAASVLGVPTERVWELLARGVLSGAPEGETGMRVFLQPRPAPAASPTPPAGNGAGREPDRELSPFRELLTEFRNLTERYGQALLALGEARGEVASLRSRVDMLEARMDLRLPVSAPVAPAWEIAPAPALDERPVAPAPQASSRVAQPERPVAQPEPEDEEEEQERRGRRRRPSWREPESFAEALARAEDPSLPDLPAGPIPAPAAREPVEDRVEAEAVDASLPHEPPVADAVPVADETAAEEQTAEEVATDEAAGEAVEPEEAPAVVAEPEPVGAPVDGGAVEDVEVQAEPERTQPAPAWQDERYTAAIEEPDWYVEDEPLPEPAQPEQEPGPVTTAQDETAADTSAETASLPGGADLDEALAGLEALSRSRPAPPAPPAATPSRPSPAAGRLTSPQIRTSGSRAYRRLRRILPG